MAALSLTEWAVLFALFLLVAWPAGRAVVGRRDAPPGGFALQATLVAILALYVAYVVWVA